MCNRTSIEMNQNEIYPLEIYKTFLRKDVVSGVEIVDFIRQIRDIYRYFEPSHYKGKLVICSSFNDELIIQEEPERIYDKSVFTNKSSQIIIVQILKSGELCLWNTADMVMLFTKEDTLFYNFENDEEYFYINKKKIDIKKTSLCSSIYSSDYSDLYEALEDYRINKTLNSSCEHFVQCWADEKHLFFKNKPENGMHISLKAHLSSAMRGINVEHEHNLDARKPVDIFVSWKGGNRQALIELKWLGDSLSEDGTHVSTSYSESRATDGAEQLKEYLDLAARDAPSHIMKGYLIVIDGRRRNLTLGQTDISEADGLYYQDKELQFDDKYDYAKRIDNFEKPIRMFAKPICH